MRTEGVYTYLCRKCGTFFAVVSRFTVSTDYYEVLKCPKCGGDASIHGEGHISHQPYESNKSLQETSAIEFSVLKSDVQETTYPIILKVEHVAEIMGVSKRVAYELMEYKGFPLFRVGRLKRVNREAFFRWLEKQNGFYT